MMNTKEFEKSYINHYKLLEDDFKSTFAYVTLEPDNYDTYSSIYLKILLSIGSEIDILKKYLASLIKSGFKEGKDDANKIIVNFDNEFQNLEIKLFSNGEIIKPWDYNKEPDWWTAYNEIKHHRLAVAVKLNSKKSYYQFANLRNVLYALSALYSLEMYVYRLIAIQHNEKIFIPTIKTLFCMNNSYWKGVQHGRGSVFIDGCLYVNEM